MPPDLNAVKRRPQRHANHAMVVVFCGGMPARVQKWSTAIYWQKAGETLFQIIHLHFSTIHAIDFLQGVGPFVKRDLLDDGHGHLKNIIPFEGGFL